MYELRSASSLTGKLCECASNYFTLFVFLQAAYHGVPIVCMPQFADQELNTMKVVSKVNLCLPCLLVNSKAVACACILCSFAR